jgi:hypothetical protein
MYSNLEACKLQCWGFWPFVIANFNAVVSAFCERFPAN